MSAIEYRWAEGDYESTSGTGGRFGSPQVAVIFERWHSSALAAKAATATIPIVFANGADPVKLGLVASLNRPGGNVTGVSFLHASWAAKRLELMHELLPRWP